MTEIIIKRDLPCQMRDGTTLYANVYRPNEAGKFPVLLQRTPYNKNEPFYSHRYIDPLRLVLAGYVVIIQDVRGRFASEGTFQPLIQEFTDGYDTVEWAASLPYSNGTVGMFGMSYYGYTQLYAALEHPPSLRAIVPAMTGDYLYGEFFERNGIAEWAATETWMLESVAPQLLKKLHITDESLFEKIYAYLERIHHWHHYSPMRDWPPSKIDPNIDTFFQTYFIHSVNRRLHTLAKEKLAEKGPIDIPSYHIAGWYDSHLGHTIKNYEYMAPSNDKQQLIIGPWSHGMFDDSIGERSFGHLSSGEYIDGKEDLTALHLHFFNHWLKGEKNTVEENPVKIFVMGTNQWRSEQTWPLQGTVYTPFYLYSKHKDESSQLGRLVRQAASDHSYNEYIYDPNNPVPTVGGATLFYKGKNQGPREQNDVAIREDVLVYTSDALQEAVEVTGWIKVVLYAKTKGFDTDFTAKLIDVLPDGTAFNLTDGIVRASQHYAAEDIKDTIQKYEIDLWATSNIFQKGHRIRLQISSSNFPRFSINPNTGNSLKYDNQKVAVKQKIYHGEDYPSHILLPIIPAER